MCVSFASKYSFASEHFLTTKINGWKLTGNIKERYITLLYGLGS